MLFCVGEQCPICMNGVCADIGGFSDKLYGCEGEWNLVQCDACGHQALSPALSHSELEKLYSVESYYSFDTRRGGIVSFLRSRTRRLLPADICGKRFLDFGCGDGEVISIAKKGGAEVFGIEFGDTPRALRERTGLAIESTPPSSWLGTMDYVRSFHSLEHVQDPGEAMELFKNLIKPSKGRILIGVPNVDSFTAKIFKKYYFYRGVPLHLHGFTPKSLQALGARYGLTVEALSTPGGFRGTLGSISLWLQSVFLGRSREPSTLVLVAMLPLYALLMPVVFIGNYLHKGDVLEVVFVDHDF